MPISTLKITTITEQLKYDQFSGPNQSRIVEQETLTGKEYWKERYRQIGEKLYTDFDKHLSMLKFSNKKTIRVCSIGCGFAEEIPPLIKFLEKCGKKLDYVGLDNQQERIARIQYIYSPLLETYKSVKFQFVATNAGQYTVLDSADKFDLVIIRHPVLSPHSPNYERQNFINIIKKTLPAILQDEGIVFATFYTNEEKQEFEKLIDQQSPKMQVLTSSVVKDENCFRTIMTTTQNQFSYDSHVIATKGFAPKPDLSILNRCLFFTMPIVAAATAATAAYLYSSDLKP